MAKARHAVGSREWNDAAFRDAEAYANGIKASLDRANAHTRMPTMAEIKALKHGKPRLGTHLVLSGGVLDARAIIMSGDYPYWCAYSYDDFVRVLKGIIRAMDDVTEDDRIRRMHQSCAMMRVYWASKRVARKAGK
jgi:hypothetical protein